eukprot:TRINITY_DN1868_c3_g7_i2.p1 TRINITY_DN1868_c3_g7~~TRINITY_DN1868_c3_g7_i2.p1  ORF type:complete len:103 (+),score=28.70 TRINITY_DN1868_c3_g7_i2:173-481(+)
MPDIVEIDGRNFTRKELLDYQKFVQDNHDLIRIAQEMKDSDEEEMYKNAGMERPQKPEPVTFTSEGKKEYDNPDPSEDNYVIGNSNLFSSVSFLTLTTMSLG